MENLIFQPITIDKKDIITSYIYPSQFQNCDFSFANMCSWIFLYESEFTVADGFLLIRFYIENRRPAYMLPVGEGDFKHAIELLEEDSKSLGHTLLLLGVTPEYTEKLKTLFPNDFKFIMEREYSDYIYMRDDLATLKGKKYQSKRNHINRFRNEYDFKYTPLTTDIIPQCLLLESKWCKENDCIDNLDLINERKSLTYALRYYRELDITGGAIWINDEIVSFTFGSPVNHNTFAVHVEKADSEIDGAYSIINQQFAEHLPEKYIYINREEDLGIEGLRKAKMSYHPAILLEKNVAIKHR